MVRKTFPTKAAAQTWRHDAMVARDRGELALPARQTIREAAESWLDGDRVGIVRNRSGDAYKPSEIRGYEKALRLRVVSRFGDVRLSDLRRIDLQDLVDEMVAEGLAASTIDSTLNPLRRSTATRSPEAMLATGPTRRATWRRRPSARSQSASPAPRRPRGCWRR